MIIVIPQAAIDTEVATRETEPAACPAEDTPPQIEDVERWDGLS